jgi:hypothetical protein
MEQATLR